jgi:cell wall-associated NlpC family hydrolase
MTSLDPRLNAFRPDLADARLAGQVASERFVEGVDCQVVAFAAPLKRVPRTDAPLDSEVLRGETFRVFEETGEGWCWGQLATDNYVGYVPADALGPVVPPPTHRIAALRTFVYPGPDLKLPALGVLSIGSRLALAGENETRGTLYRHLAGGGGTVVADHVQRLDAPYETDFVAVAERFRETPYLWGGRTSIGLDCSALVQLSLLAAGRGAPRDTDLQERLVGEPVAGGVSAGLARGDLVFWRGHVAIMVDRRHMIHASGWQMRVVVEPFAEAVERIARSAGLPTAMRRLSG